MAKKQNEPEISDKETEVQTENKDFKDVKPSKKPLRKFSKFKKGK